MAQSSNERSPQSSRGGRMERSVTVDSSAMESSAADPGSPVIGGDVVLPPAAVYATREASQTRRTAEENTAENEEPQTQRGGSSTHQSQGGTGTAIFGAAPRTSGDMSRGSRVKLKSSERGNDATQRRSEVAPSGKAARTSKRSLEIEKIVKRGDRTSRGGGDSVVGNLTRRLMGGGTKSQHDHPVRPLCTTTVAQQLEANYDELWVRTTGIRDKRQLIYLIPGNPGLTKAYGQFAKLLCLRFRSDVCVVSHLGHCSFSSDFFGLDSHVTHHHRVLRKHSSGYSSVVLLGHSIGGYFALRAVEAAEASGSAGGSELSDKLTSVGLIAPTVSRFAFSSYWFCRVVSAPFIRFLAPMIYSMIPKFRTLHHGLSQELVNELRSGKFLPNVLHLVRDELASLTEIPRQILWKWGVDKRKLFVIYAKNDKYVSYPTQLEVKNSAQDQRQDLPTVLSLSTLRHAFCLHTADCLSVVDLMSDFLTHGGFTSETISTVDRPAEGIWTIIVNWLFHLLPKRTDISAGILRLQNLRLRFKK